MDGFQFLFEGGELAVFEFRRLVKVVAALGFGDLVFRLLEFGLEVSFLLDGFLFLLPLGVEDVLLFLQFGKILLQLFKPGLASVVAFLLQGLLLNFKLHDLAVQLVQFRGLAVNFRPDHRRGFVHKVDSLVGQETVADVAVAKNSRTNKRAVLDPDAVMDLVALLQAS